VSQAPPESSARSPRYVYLALAVALSAVPLIVLSLTERLGYDAFWHVFIARQADWRSLWDEIRWTAHPPVFFLCLKAAIAALGTSPLAYRLIPILGTVGSTWLVGRIVQRTAGQPWLPAAAAFAFGSSLTAVSVGLDVRAYSLGTFFVLWACLSFLELVEHGFSAPRHRARVIFALMTSLALLTHYGTALFLLSCFPAAVAPAVFDREYRHRLREARRHWMANLLTFGIPTAVLAAAYAIHIVSWSTRPFNHLTSFLFDADREGALEFVWRNSRALIELFVPALDYQPFNSTLDATAPGLPNAVAGTLAVASLAAVAWLGFRPLGKGGVDGLARRIPAVLLAAMTALVIVLALLGRYPYGGQLRHQFFLFPFAVIVLSLLIDEVARRSNRRIAGLVVCLFGLAGLLNAAHWLTHHRITGGDWVRIDPFDEPLPLPEAIYVDQANLIHLFRLHHDWQWRFMRRLRGRAPVDLWRVGKAGARGFYVCRDRREWQLDFSDRDTYFRLRRCLDATGGTRLAVFRWQQKGTSAEWPVAPTEELAGRAAAAAGLVPDDVLVRRGEVYAAFARR